MLAGVLACLSAAPALCAGERPGADLQLSATVEQYALEEIRFNVPGKADNPYSTAEIQVDGYFTCPSGRIVALPAFYWESWDPIQNAPGGGGKGWRLRFTPAEVGRYKVQVNVSRGPWARPAAFAKGEFDCTASQRPGFVKAAGKGFGLTTGGSFLAIGADRCWGDLKDRKGYMDDLDKLSAAGANCVRVWLAPWWLPIESKGGTCDQGASALLDLIMRRAEADHLKVILCIEQHGNFEPQGSEVGGWSSNPYNAANGGPCKSVSEFFTKPAARRLFRDWLRYLIARWGYSTSLMSWELFNEVEWVPFQKGDFRAHEADVVEWHREMAAFVRRNDPFGHLVGTSSDAELQKKLVEFGAVDFVELHIYDKGDLAGRVKDDVAPLAQQLTVPVIIGEFGGPEEKDGRFVTRGIFSAVLSGAAGALPWLQDTADTAPCYRRLGIARRFLDAALSGGNPMLPTDAEIAQGQGEEAGGPAWRRTPNLHAMALARDGLIVAFCYEWPVTEGGGWNGAASASPRLLIPGVTEGRYSAEALDCSTGTVARRQTLMLNAPAGNGAGRSSGTLPLDTGWSGDDIAIKVAREGAKAQPER